ncbi:MAG TPA: response regulator, partial [Candidatus Brocadiia bacterium]|nr:response regulator [Candidatus Brocadiia bacterium]
MDKALLMLVDDVEENLVVLREMIGEYLPECEAVSARRGEEALTLAASRPPSCFLLDMHMPGMDGVELTRRIRANEALAHIPIILITAYKNTPATRAHALDTGADDFISKPVDSRELVAKIRVMLRIKAAEDKMCELNARLEKLVAERTEALGESEERYRALFCETASPILVVDNKGAFIDANAAALRFLECSREEILTRNLGDFGGSGSGRDRLQRFLRQWDEGGAFEMDFCVQGKVKTLEITTNSARWNDRRVIFGVGKDVAERKLLDREVLMLGEEERRRLGQEVREEICRPLASAIEAASGSAVLVRQLTEARDRAEALAAGMMAEELARGGVEAALGSLAAMTSRLRGVRCECQGALKIEDPWV